MYEEVGGHGPPGAARVQIDVSLLDPHYTDQADARFRTGPTPQGAIYGVFSRRNATTVSTVPSAAASFHRSTKRAFGAKSAISREMDSGW